MRVTRLSEREREYEAGRERECVCECVHVLVYNAGKLADMRGNNTMPFRWGGRGRGKAQT